MVLTVGLDTSEKRGGLNNQRLALLGLCASALQEGNRCILPKTIVDLNAMSYQKSSYISLFDVFSEHDVQSFLSRWNLEGNSSTDFFLDWGQSFSDGVQLTKKIPDNGNFIKDFLLSFCAAPNITALAEKAALGIGEGSLALQLRIEMDWHRHAARKKKEGKKGIFILEAKDILRKVVETPGFEGIRTIYACCDRAALSQDPEEIRSMGKRDFGLNILYKDDILDKRDIPESSIQNAMLDFEICLLSDRYVGIRRSTFSNLLLLTSSAKSKPGIATQHYIYDNPDRTVIIRPQSSFEHA